MRKVLLALMALGVTLAATVAAASPATAAPRTASADLAAVVIAPSGLSVGSVDYVVGINNLGPDTVTSATLTVRLPRQVVTATAPQCTYNRRTDVATCTVGPIVGDSAILWELNARFGVLSFGVHLATTATVTASTLPDPNPANNSQTVTCRANVSLLVLC